MSLTQKKYEKHTPVYLKIKQALNRSIPTADLIEIWNRYADESAKNPRLKIFYPRCKEEVLAAFDNSLADFYAAIVPVDDGFFIYYDKKIHLCDTLSELPIYDIDKLIDWLLEDPHSLQGYAESLGITEHNFCLVIPTRKELYNHWKNGLFVQDPGFPAEPIRADFEDDVDYADAWSSWLCKLAKQLEETQRLESRHDGSYRFYS